MVCALTKRYRLRALFNLLLQDNNEFTCYTFVHASLSEKLPTTVVELQQLLLEKQSLIEKQAKELAASQSLNKALEEKLRLLNQKHFAKSSEKNPGQAELQFLNEAEMLHSQDVRDETEREQ